MDNGAAVRHSSGRCSKAGYVVQPDYGCNQCGARLAVYLSFWLGSHGSSICHFHQHHGRRTGGDGLSTVLCSAFAFTTTQMECQEPAAFRAEYWLPVPYRSFCLIGRGNACCSYVRREPGIYVLSGGRWRRGIRYSVLLYSFCFHGR